MTRYLIEIPHSPDRLECLRAVSILLSSGSHFLTHADWGCYDGVHKAWFFMDAETKEEVLRIIPPAYRKDAHVMAMNKFQLAEVDNMIKTHMA